MHTEHVSLDVGSDEAAVRALGTHAVDCGYAADPYVDALLERESSHPTGLPVPNASFGVAIPHADPEHVREQALILGLPEEAVPFASMDDPSETVAAEAVVLLLVTDTDGYATFLSNLAGLFGDPEFVDAVRADDGDRVLDLIEETCLAGL